MKIIGPAMILHRSLVATTPGSSLNEEEVIPGVTQDLLRGCIGTFEPLPIREGIAEYALISAFRDSRFRKIERHELESLECGYESSIDAPVLRVCALLVRCSSLTRSLW